MTTYNVGEVLLVPFPFTNQAATKKRPTVVISSALYNQQKPDLILMAITSQIREPLQLGERLIVDWIAAGLLKPSVIKPIVTSLEKALVIKSLGHLQASDLEGLETVLHQIIGDYNLAQRA